MLAEEPIKLLIGDLGAGRRTSKQCGERQVPPSAQGSQRHFRDCSGATAHVEPLRARRIYLRVGNGTRIGVGANDAHGLRRTNDDKRKAVLTLLKDEEWAKWSNREVARRCAVDHTFVGKLRGSLVLNTSENQRTFTTKHGTTATMQILTGALSA